MFIQCLCSEPRDDARCHQTGGGEGWGLEERLSEPWMQGVPLRGLGWQAQLSSRGKGGHVSQRPLPPF